MTKGNLASKKLVSRLHALVGTDEQLQSFDSEAPSQQ
jgi:hypothetical protein